MSASKHSPGPWHWKEELGREEQPVLLDANNGWVLDFGYSETYYPTEGNSPSDADARLIAAAPELLKALKAAVDGIVADADPDTAAWQALIARIEGGG